VVNTDLAVLRTAGLSARKAEYSKFSKTWNSLCLFLKTVQDLAARFADGRLSTDKLLQANDEELAEMLIQVRGIGRVSIFVSILPMFSLIILVDWYMKLLCSPRINTYQFPASVDMFAIFSLRRPDILPVGLSL
jgi:DNA-3-methyladenine glycosylase II